MGGIHGHTMPMVLSVDDHLISIWSAYYQLIISIWCISDDEMYSLWAFGAASAAVAPQWWPVGAGEPLSPARRHLQMQPCNTELSLSLSLARRHLQMQPTQSCNTQYNVWFRFHNYCLWAARCKAPHCIIPRWSSMHNSKKGFSYKGHLQMQPSVHTRHKKHFSVFNWTSLCKHTFSILKVT